MNNKKYVSALITLTTLATLMVAVPALADNNGSSTQSSPQGIWGGRNGRGEGMMNRVGNGVFGTVSAINGNIITVTSKRGGPKATTNNATTTTTTYTIDATNAKITKNNVAGTIGSILVGDTLVAQGTLTGTNLVATTIRDGALMLGKGRDLGNETNNGANQTLPFTGNGQPIVAGTVSSINGSTLTITNKSNVSYTVDATNAKIVQGQTTITVSNIVVGDSVVVQGTINGNTVTASNIIDQKVTTTTTGTTTQPNRGFFGSIGSFFSRLFGF